MRKKQSPRYNSNDILHFHLMEALPGGSVLALNIPLCILSYVTLEDNKGPQVIYQERFSRAEIKLLTPLLECFPYYCPYEVLHASLQHGSTNEQAVASSRQRLQEAGDLGIWSDELHSVQSLISRVRLKLHLFGMDIIAQLEIGYQLSLDLESFRKATESI